MGQRQWLYTHTHTKRSLSLCHHAGFEIDAHGLNFQNRDGWRGAANNGSVRNQRFLLLFVYVFLFTLGVLLHDFLTSASYPNQQ